jgi:8-oxo-dGTP diphosphatase
MTTYYLIRHAHAGHRQAWDDDDHHRTLSEKGVRQAVGIVDALADEAVSRVVSSPATRCEQTVTPLAHERGREVELDDVLFEGSDPTGVIRLMESDDGGGLALCTHGDLIPEVIRLLKQRGMRVSGERGNKKGSWWTITVNGAGFTDAVYHPPAH